MADGDGGGHDGVDGELPAPHLWGHLHASLTN
jgi:hypothetical protein